MKKVLLIASLIGLFMAASMDLQARYSRNDQPRNVRSVISSSQSRHAPSRNRSNSYSQYGNRQGRNVRGGISFGLSLYAPMLDRYNSYGRYYNRPGRYVASEIRRIEERIWILEERLDRLYRYGGDYREIRALEQEINYLARRNDFLRSQLY